MRALIPCCILISALANGQAAHSAFRKLSGPEKRWVLFHPFIAKKTFALTRQVIQVCDSMKKDSSLDGDGSGGQLDAFRHAYWMALLSHHIPARKAYALGTAHEKGNELEFRKGMTEDNARPDSMACVMDLVNDQLGIELGLRHPDNDSGLVEVIRQAVLSGQLRILAKDEKGNYLDVAGEVIDPDLYKGKWGIPKCLVRSDVRRWKE